MTTSLDGYFEGLNHDISWHKVDEEHNQFAIELLRGTDTILFGRRTYELFESFWPNAADDPRMSTSNLEIARLINNMSKIVFSRSLERVQKKKNWKNVRLVHSLDPEEVARWKQQPGKDISVGGNDLAMSLVRNGLLDEFRIMVNPIALGSGTPLFRGLEEKMSLKLLNVRTFKSGNVLLCYHPDISPTNKLV